MPIPSRGCRKRPCASIVACARALVALAIAVVVLAPRPAGTRGLTSALMIGLATGITSVNLFAVGILQGPVSRDFGWTQTRISIGG